MGGARHSRFAARRPRANSGQAIIEFVVGIVAIMALTAGLVQLGLLSLAQTDTMNEARERVGRLAMSSSYYTLDHSPDYILDWAEGADERQYSVDDTRRLASQAELKQYVISSARPGALSQWAPGNEISGLDGSVLPVQAFGFVHAKAQSEAVPLMPFVQSMIYNADSIVVKSEVWSVWTKGIR